MTNIATLIRESIRYGAGALVALVVDVALLAFLTKGLGWHYLAAASISFFVGGVALYLICVRFVFRFRRVTNRAIELPTFVALGLAGFIVNAAVIYVAVENFASPLIPAKLLAAGCTFGINFLLRRLILFTPSIVET